MGAVSTTLQWERSPGRAVNEDDRVMVFSDGTLFVSGAKVDVDSGSYSCVATNEYGTSAAVSDVIVLRESHSQLICPYPLKGFVYDLQGIQSTPP